MRRKRRAILPLCLLAASCSSAPAPGPDPLVGSWEGAGRIIVTWCDQEQLPIALAYIVANLLLGFHLSHGIASLFQTLGFNDPKWEPHLKGFARGAAFVIAAGNISMPLAVLTGLVGLPGGS